MDLDVSFLLNITLDLCGKCVRFGLKWRLKKGKSVHSVKTGAGRCLQFSVYKMRATQAEVLYFQIRKQRFI